MTQWLSVCMCVSVTLTTSACECVCVCVCVSVCVGVCVCNTSETQVARKHFITAVLFTHTDFLFHTHIVNCSFTHSANLSLSLSRSLIVFFTIIFQSHFINVITSSLSHDRKLIKTYRDNAGSRCRLTLSLTHTHTRTHTHAHTHTHTHTHTGSIINHNRQNGSNEVASC